MTIIALYNNYPLASFNHIEKSGSYTLPETAQLKNGKPFFIPDYAVPCLIEVHFAVRISRLGRNIGRRFANRYYDAATVVPHFFSPSMLELAQKNGLPWSSAMGFDSSVPIGDFLSLSSDEVQHQAFSLSVDGKPVMKGNTANMLQSVDEIIADVSRFHTLRRGDLLLTGAPVVPLPIAMNSSVEAFLNEEKVLSFNVK